LELATKAVNDTMGLEELIPTLLVFGALPRPARKAPAESQFKRALAIDKAMQEISRIHAERKISFGKRYKGPFGGEREDLELPHRSPVLVYREASGVWEGPHRFIFKEGETVCVETSSGRRLFRSCVVKPSSRSVGTTSDDLRPKNADDIGIDADDTAIEALTMAASTPNFSEARRQEICGLLERGTFDFIKRSEVNSRIFGTKWVDKEKDVAGVLKLKSRLVAQNFRDAGAASIATKAPTVSRFGLRIAVLLNAIFTENTCYIRDISQAYVQSHTKLERPVFLEPPPEMALPDDIVLRAVLPLYGIPESGLHWFLTYQGHHKQKLRMQAANVDSCFLFRRQDDALCVTVMQVDDTFGHGPPEFLKEEDVAAMDFVSKPRTELQVGEQHVFNGMRLCRTSHGFTLSQKDKLESIQVPRLEEDLISVRAKIQYIGACTRPDLASPAQLLASEMKTPTNETYGAMKKLVARCRDTVRLGLKYVTLDRHSLRLALFTDASFANNRGYASQLGFVLVLVDKYDMANIVTWGSQKSKRITRSVMAAELLALVYGFDIGYVIKKLLSEVLGHDLPLDAYTDSRTVFNTIAKLGPTMEKRLQIDASSLRESHARGEFRTLAWIPGHENPADALTKGPVADGHALLKLMESNKLSINPRGWVQDAH
jgi:hypothetical protein